MYQDASKFSIRISSNPFAIGENDQTKEKNREKLKQVIYNRIENRELVEDEAADFAVAMCGGNLKFLIDIIQRAARNAISLDEENSVDIKLTKVDIESAVHESAALPSLSVMKRVKVLKYVLSNFKEPENEEMRKDFIDSVLDNSVFAYFNGLPWYEVNPVIKESVEKYSSKLNEPK